MKSEAMQKAVDSMGFAVSDLQEAYRNSAGLQTIVIESLLKRAADLRKDIARARDAMSDTTNHPATVHSETCASNNFREGSEERKNACTKHRTAKPA